MFIILLAIIIKVFALGVPYCVSCLLIGVLWTEGMYIL